MAKDYTIFVGCVGGGLSYSPDGGDTWERVRTPLPSECNVRALTVYPDDPHRILVGSDVGVFRSNDNGSNWEHIESPMDNVQVWSSRWILRTQIPFLSVPVLMRFDPKMVVIRGSRSL